VNIESKNNFLEILSIPTRALKAKKIFVSSLCLLIAFVLYYIFTHLAHTFDGGEAVTVYSLFGVQSQTIYHFDFFIPIIIYLTGIFLAFFSIMIGFMAVSVFDFEALRGNQFLSIRQALKFSWSKIRQLLLSWLVIILFVGFIVLLGFIVGLITRIPYLGEILYSLFFFFPNFIISLFTVLIIIVMIPGVLVMPAAVAADRSGETFNSILEMFSTIIKQPIRWVGYTAYSLIAAKVSGFIFAYFTYQAILFLIFTTQLGGGGKIDSVIGAGVSHLPLKHRLVEFITNIFPGINFGFDINLPSVGQSGVAGYILAASFYLVFLTVYGYIFSVVATGQAYIYAVIKKIRVGCRINNEKSFFCGEEYINPPLEPKKNEIDKR